ncbi:FomA family porin-like outer membrane protein [Fusobacterium sp. PH5-44]|uniref:FomA family porin-like outer membrane protein n=1 Tax=unclassified Fusobacterium TaxID=2648384 RepID=UPI003D208CEE
MKKLALLLGSLAIAATSYAGGKEYVPPVENVQVREIYVDRPVYRNIMNGGYLEMYYRWWGKSTTHSHDDYEHAEYDQFADEWDIWESDKKVDRAGVKNRKIKDRRSNGNRGRLHIQGLVNLTERQSIYFRVRDNQAISNNGNRKWQDLNGELVNKYSNSGESTQVRIRYSYKHDFANLNATSRVHYQNDGEYTGAAVGRNNLEYTFRMQFAEYMLDNNFIKTTNFTVAPKIGYSWDNSSRTSEYTVPDPNKYGNTKDESGHASTPYFGIDLLTEHKLPWNFSFEFNVYLNSVHSNYKFYDGKKSNFQAFVEAKLYNKTPLWKGDKATLSFYFEGGFDPYKYSQRRVFAHSMTDTDIRKNGMEIMDKTDYSLFALPALTVDYQATENVNLFVGAGARLENIHTAGCEAQGFEWQPEAWAGFKVNF